MTLMRWDPFRDLLDFRARFGPQVPGKPAGDGLASWAPSVDILEQDDNLVIRAELPGVSKNDISIEIVNDTLELSGERKQNREVGEGKTYHRERSFGRFVRRFILPTSVDSSRIEARHTDGVLQITLPKLEAAKPRKIEVQAA